MEIIKKKLTQSKRVVIKIGSSLLVNHQHQISKSVINRLVRFLIKLQTEKKEVILVSSGAVAAANIQYQQKLSLEFRQALASIGQVKLMEHYQKAFQKKKVIVGQILFSKHSIKNRIAYLNARNTLRELLKLKAIPIINENDSLATDEFKFGDNDILGALTCGLIDADLYLILSNVDGFYKNYLQKKIIPLVEKIDKSIYQSISKTTSKFGSGGMESKLKACELTKQWGIPTFLTSGKAKHLYKNIFVKNQGTLFYHQGYKQISSKKKWLWSNYDSQGKIYVDLGAQKALANNKSLLPSGIKKIEGNFKAGDFCSIFFQNKLLGRGLINFSQKELNKIKGQHSKRIPFILGYTAHSEVIHKDNLISFE